MLDASVSLRIRYAKDLQHFILGRGGEGKVAGVGQQLSQLHQAVDLVLVGLFFALFTCLVDKVMAKLRPRCSLPISSRIKGNFCTVEMMIFLPSSMNLRRSPERSAYSTVAPNWAYCLMVSWICRSRRIRSVTTMIEPKMLLPTFCNPISW